MLKRLVVLFEPEVACKQRLAAQGIVGEPAAEIACYLAQATDLPAFYERIRAAFALDGVGVDFFAVAETAVYLPILLAEPESCVLWNLTDGFRYYRASYATSLAALLGVPTFGSPPQAQHLCQDKYKVLALGQSLGICTPPTTLGRNGRWLSPTFSLPDNGYLFVKPNTLGAKVGIFADSKCRTWEDAAGLTQRLWQRYGDDAVVQPFIPGYDVRVSFMNAAAEGQTPQLGIYRLTGTEAGETGGAFMTMQDNWTLSASYTESEPGIGLPSARPPIFRPKMIAMGREGEQTAVVDQIQTAVAQIVTLFELRDYYSFDFRVSETGQLYFLEFEVCPAVTIYDFLTYLEQTYAIDLPQALRRAVYHSLGCVDLSP